MSLSGLITKIEALAKNDTLNRAVKTIIEVVAVQSALYTTVVPNPPSLQTSGAVAGGSGVFAVLISLIVKWAQKNQAKKLAVLQTAINEAAAALNAANQLQAAAAQKPA